MSETMLEALAKYGERSADGLGRMRDALKRQLRKAPEELDILAGTVAGFMPGHGFLRSSDIAREAGRHWRNGDYGKSMVRMSDALVEPMYEATWILPGAQAVRKIPK